MISESSSISIFKLPYARSNTGFSGAPQLLLSARPQPRIGQLAADTADSLADFEATSSPVIRYSASRHRQRRKSCLPVHAENVKHPRGQQGGQRSTAFRAILRRLVWSAKSIVRMLCVRSASLTSRTRHLAHRQQQFAKVFRLFVIRLHFKTVRASSRYRQGG